MKKVIIRISLAVLVIIGLVVSFLIFSSKEETVFKDEEKNAVQTETSLSLVMVGDGLIHGAVYDDAKTSTGYDFTSMLEEMKPIISSYDLAFYNQESILGGEELGLSTYPRFNSPYEVGDAFLDAGFNLVSLANNHTLDRGEQAILNSVNYWKDKDAYVAGSYSSYEDRNNIVIKEVNGIKYALLSYTCWTNGLSIPDGKTYLLNRYDEETVKQDIEKVRDQVDLLMVSMHFGDEYSFTPSSSQKEIATYLASLGVDIIIGHHPHVVQPIEFIDDTLVIYSLGNFLSGQRGIEKLTGLMVSVDVVKDLSTNKISLQNVSSELTYTYSDEKKGYRGNFKVYPYTKLTESILPNYETYYNKYMVIVTHGDIRIGKSDYSGNS
jgi:poly-gamma-glutamate synthesis protein (capsule biosynthesis protein)